MRWMKFIVIILGLLIICGVGLLGYGFYKKTSDPGWKLFSSAPQSEPSNTPQFTLKSDNGPLPKIGDINLPMAPGCFIRTARPEGKRLYVILGPRDTCSKVVIIDVTSGQTLGTISPSTNSSSQ